MNLLKRDELIAFYNAWSLSFNISSVRYIDLTPKNQILGTPNEHA